MASVTATPDAKNWWEADKPAEYESRFSRTTDGRVVFANASTASNATKALEASKTGQPRILEPNGPMRQLQQWRQSRNGTRTMKTVRQILYDLEAPIETHGRTWNAQTGRTTSASTGHIGRAMLRQAKSPMAMEAAADAVKGVLSFVKSKYTNYIESEIRKLIPPKYSALELHKMFIEQNNLTAPRLTAADVKEARREKNVKSYTWVGDERPLFFKAYSSSFQPFPGYSNEYYTPDDDLPEPTVPAPSYPWQWSGLLDVVRDIALGAISTREDAARTQREDIDDGEGDKFELPTTLLPPHLQAQQDEENRQQEHLHRLNTNITYRREEMRKNAKKPDDGDSLPLPMLRRLRQAVNDLEAGGGDAGDDGDLDEPLDENEKFIDEQTLETMERVVMLRSQFHLTSGIPRFVLQSNDSRRLFPSFEAYQRNVSRYIKAAVKDHQGDNLAEMEKLVEKKKKQPEVVDQVVDSEKQPEAVNEVFKTPMYHTDDGKHVTRRRLAEDSPSTEQQDAAEYSFEGDDTVYSALLDFYAYPAVDKEMLVVEPEDLAEAGYSSNGAIPECKILAPCRMQSGVTVYTPLLSNLSVLSFMANPIEAMTLASPTAARMAGLREMVDTAFTMETEALRHGLQAPSTVWYSVHDQQSDEFADALVGFANMSNATEVLSPSATFERFYDKKRSLIDWLPSYYQTTVSATTYVMDKVKSVPKPMNLSESELVELLDLSVHRIKTLDQAVAAYKRVRDRDPQRQVLLAEIERREFYYGSEYSLLGFGYLMPETNSKNAVLKDMRLPVGLHLLMRLLTRFHESRVLLPDESKFLLACLALMLNDTPYYRCRPRRAPPAPIID